PPPAYGRRPAIRREYSDYVRPIFGARATLRRLGPDPPAYPRRSGKHRVGVAGARGVRSADGAAQEVERVLAGDLADVRIRVAAGYQPADDVRAVGGRLQPIQVRSRQLGGRVAAQHHAMKADVVANLSVGANPDMVDADELHEVVVVVEHAVDVLP